MATSSDPDAADPAPRRSAAHSLRHSATAHGLARFGLAARGGLYLLLAYLTAALVLHRPGAVGPADAQGAMQEVGTSPLGLAALAGTGVGFAAFAVVRVATAATHRDAGAVVRLTTGGQGLLYLGFAWVPTSYLLGQHGSGSDEEQRQTAGDVLGLPGGQVLLFGVGLVVLAMCAWQVRTALRSDHLRGLALPERPLLVHRLLVLLGQAGIVARALVVVPVGVFLLVAAVTRDAHQTRGLDQELSTFAGSDWGVPVLLLACTGFVLFAAYSFVEARYRQLHES